MTLACLCGGLELLIPWLLGVTGLGALLSRFWARIRGRHTCSSCPDTHTHEPPKQ